MSDMRGAFTQLAVAETYVKDGILLVKDSFPICPSFGVVWYREVDLGFPDVRGSVQDLPEADGTMDSTQYTGARQVTVTGVVINDAFGTVPAESDWPTSVAWNSATWFCTLLSGWASPARRYRFYLTDETGRSRFMDVRGDSFSVPANETGSEYREFQLGMVCPSGRIYTFATGSDATPDGRRITSIAAIAADVAGRAYPLSEPRTYPTVSGTGRSEIFYTGTVPVGFTVEVYTGGSVLNGPRITVTDPYGSASSIGLNPAYTIPAHTTVIFDTVNRIVTQQEDNSSVVSSLERYLHAPLQWPQLRPGSNPLADTEAARRLGYNQVSYSQSVGTPDPNLSITVKHYAADLA